MPRCSAARPAQFNDSQSPEGNQRHTNAFVINVTARRRLPRIHAPLPGTARAPRAVHARRLWSSHPSPVCSVQPQPSRRHDWERRPHQVPVNLAQAGGEGPEVIAPLEHEKCRGTVIVRRSKLGPDGLARFPPQQQAIRVPAPVHAYAYAYACARHGGQARARDAWHSGRLGVRRRAAHHGACAHHGGWEAGRELRRRSRGCASLLDLELLE